MTSPTNTDEIHDIHLRYACWWAELSQTDLPAAAKVVGAMLALDADEDTGKGANTSTEELARYAGIRDHGKVVVALSTLAEAGWIRQNDAGGYDMERWPTRLLLNHNDPGPCPGHRLPRLTHYVTMHCGDELHPDDGRATSALMEQEPPT